MQLCIVNSSSVDWIETATSTSVCKNRRYVNIYFIEAHPSIVAMFDFHFISSFRLQCHHRRCLSVLKSCDVHCVCLSHIYLFAFFVIVYLLLTLFTNNFLINKRNIQMTGKWTRNSIEEAIRIYFLIALKCDEVIYNIPRRMPYNVYCVYGISFDATNESVYIMELRYCHI